MDLIYSDKNGIDIGVITDYSFDLAYGKDENNFELTVPLTCYLGEGYHIYCEYVENGKPIGTEYGGIIDGLKVDTLSKQIIYNGRTWHGILESRVICPDYGYDYFSVNGDANAVLKEIITHIQLDDIFDVTSEASGIEIIDYQFRYDYAYSAILAMIGEYNGKLNFKRQKDGKILLSIAYAIDYSQDEEWTSINSDFNIGKNYRPINHLICLGQGELKDRAVIHLFTDENGGVQPYSLVDDPLQDSDYILDSSMQVLKGTDERTEIYDYPSVEITENYIPLNIQPLDWSINYMNYFSYDEENNEYKECEGTEEKAYNLLTSKPSDWDKCYTNYFTKNNDKYNSVEGVLKEIYKKLIKKPVDWSKNYGNYYYFYTDGVTDEYKKVDGITKYKYKVQTKKPSDWASNYSSYYKRKKKGGYEKVEAVTKNKKKYAPVWKKNTYYIQIFYSVAPQFIKNKYYVLSKTITSVPAFKTNTYYQENIVNIKPSFKPNVFFIKVYDNYSKLVEGGIEKLKESYDCDTIDRDFDYMNSNYDIGDIVGGNEENTGISVWQAITKKIVSIVNGKINLNYEIGDDKQ